MAMFKHLAFSWKHLSSYGFWCQHWFLESFPCKKQGTAVSAIETNTNQTENLTMGPGLKAAQFLVCVFLWDRLEKVL